MRRASWFGACAVGLALSAAPSRAGAYCRTSVCEGGIEGHVCFPAQPSDCGKPITWVQPCIGFDVQEDASRQVTLAQADEIMKEAGTSWLRSSCGSSLPSIGVTDLGSIACDKAEYNQHGGNANVLVFRDDGWPHGSGSPTGTTDTLALTTVTYDVVSGEIYDADIEVNTTDFTFTTGGASAQADLLSVVTHEVGHYFGIAHTPVSGATMTPDYPGGTSLRTLSPDDMEAMCAAYPPGRATTGDCVPIPRHGFSPACLADQTESNCTLSAARSNGDGIWALALLGAAAIARRRKG